jgi:hypothetical protein
MEPTVYLAFGYGLCGSVVIELVFFLRAMGPRGAIPGKYKTTGFWLPRGLLAIFSGFIATSYFSQNIPLYLALHTDSSFPRFLVQPADYLCIAAAPRIPG